jgi:iron complex outermembrane recepter protein
MNASFQSNNTFRDLITGEDVFLAPIIKWNISPQTQATLEMEYQHERKAWISKFYLTILKKAL